MCEMIFANFMFKGVLLEYCEDLLSTDLQRMYERQSSRNQGEIFP